MGADNQSGSGNEEGFLRDGLATNGSFLLCGDITPILVDTKANKW